MKAGSLVVYTPPPWPFNKPLFHPAPGLILEVCDEINVTLSGSRRYRVMWANQVMTVEWGCYLETMDE